MGRRCGLLLSIFALAMLAPVSAHAKVYVLGGLYSEHYHNGKPADWGQDALIAAYMAIHDINASGMLGADTLSMPSSMVIDYKCWPKGVASLAKSLLIQDVVAVTGVDCSGPAVRIARVAQEFKEPAVSYGANTPALSSASKFPFFYRVVAPSGRFGGDLIRIVEHYGIKKVAIFYTTDAYGLGLANAIENKAKEADIRIAAAYGYPRGTPLGDVETRMSAVKETGAKTIFILMPVPDTATAFKAVDALGMDKPGYAFFASEMLSPGEPQDVIDGADGYLAPIAKLPPSKELDNFAERLEKKIGTHIDRNSAAFFWSVLSYDHIEAIGHAIADAEKAGVKNVSGPVLMEYLRKVSFTGLSGEIHAAPGTNDRESMSVEFMNLQGYHKDGKTLRYVRVGSFNPATGKLDLDASKILWPGDTKNAPHVAQ